MPETRKTNTFIEKTIRVSETLKNSYERGHSTASETKNNNFIEKTILISKTLYSLDKKTQHRRAKCPRPTKPALSLKRQFYFLKRKDLAKNYKKQFLNISPLDFWKKKNRLPIAIVPIPHGPWRQAHHCYEGWGAKNPRKGVEKPAFDKNV